MFTFKKEQLVKPLGYLNSIVERNSVIPILNNILMEIVDSKRIRFTASDNELQLSVLLSPESITGERNTTLPSKKLLDITRSMGEGESLAFTAKDGDVVGIKSGKSRFSLRSLNAEDFPKFDHEQADAVSFEIMQGKLKQQLQRVESAMAQDSVRYYLNGVLFSLKNGELNVVSTDGNRLHFSKAVVTGEDVSKQVIVPRKAIKELVRILDDSDNLVKIKFNDKAIKFNFNEVEMVSKVVSGTFPNYERVMPTRSVNNESVVIPKVELVNLIKRVSVVLENEKAKYFKFNLSKNSLGTEASNKDNEVAEDELSVDYDGGSINIGFNIQFISEALSAVETDVCELRFKDSDSSVCIYNYNEKSANDDDFIVVVMPVKI